MKNLLLIFLISFSGIVFSQTPGMIFEPATGVGAAVLDPNGDGYVSQNTGGFILNDLSESEIPYVAFVFPGTEPTSDINNGPNCGFTDIVDSVTEVPTIVGKLGKLTSQPKKMSICREITTFQRLYILKIFKINNFNC